MAITRKEVEMNWLGSPLPEEHAGLILEAFARVEQMLGRTFLEGTAASGMLGAITMLPVWSLGKQLAFLQGASGADKLIYRLQQQQPAANSELHALALCAAHAQIEFDIEPAVAVGRLQKVPDFRMRGSVEPWIHVEVTQPRESEAAILAQRAAASLRDLLPTIPFGIDIQVRFRDEPTDEDILGVRKHIPLVNAGTAIDRERFVLLAEIATGVITPKGRDELCRPIFGNAAIRKEGERIASISVRVPYTDARGQQVIDTEARQLPPEGPNLICIKTHHGKYWGPLIERSFSPAIRRRISGVLLFESGICPVPDGIELQTSGCLLLNPYARTPLPAWLIDRLRILPPTLGSELRKANIERLLFRP